MNASPSLLIDGARVAAAESAPSLLDLAETFARFKQTDFWISPKLLDAELAKYRNEESNRRR